MTESDTVAQDLVLIYVLGRLILKLIYPNFLGRAASIKVAES
jgi:hypothetical protein